MDICGPNNENNAQGNFFVLISLTNTSRNNKVWTTITPSELAYIKNHKSPTYSTLHKESKCALEELSNWKIACRFLHLPGASYYLFHTSSQSPRNLHTKTQRRSVRRSVFLCVTGSSLPVFVTSHLCSVVASYGVAFFQGDYIHLY